MNDPTSVKIPRLWRQDDPSARRVDPGSRHRRVIFTLQAAIMALAGAIVGMLSFISPAPRPRLIPLFVARHTTDRLPSPPMARNDLRNLDGRWYFAGLLPSARRKPTPASRTGQEFRSELTRLSRSPLDRRAAVVVYVRANAAVLPAAGGAGKSTAPGKGSGAAAAAAGPRVFILPADADSADPREADEIPPTEAWVPLGEVLDALAECRARQKLLVLDLNPLTLPRAGALDGDVAAAVRAELKELDNLPKGKERYPLVLTSCGPGETPLASDDLGRSAFGYYMEEALRGWADGVGGVADGTVTVKELAAFVSARVDQWARSNRGARQQPALYQTGAGRDFPLVILDRGRPRPHLTLPRGRELDPAKPAVPFPAWLERAWAERDRWRAEGHALLAPRAFRAMEAHLLRAEEDWRHGDDPATVEKALRARIDGLKAEWAVALGTPRPNGFRSLALAASLGVAPEPALVRDVETLRRELTEGFRSEKPEDAAKSRDARVAAFLTAHASVPDLEVKLARAVLTVGAGVTPSVETVRELDRVLRAAVARLGPGAMTPAEALSLRRLAELAATWPAGPGRPDWPVDVAQQLLVLADRSADAGARPRIVRWVRPLLEEASRDRHDAELMVREQGYVPLAEARELVGRAGGRFEGVGAAARAHDLARDALGGALELLPALVDVLDDIPQGDESWTAAASRARELADLLRPPPAPFRSAPESAPRVEAISRSAGALAADLDTLRGALARRTQRLTATDREAATPEQAGADVRAIEALLATPLPVASQRTALWAAARRLARPTLATSRGLDLRAGAAASAPVAADGDSAGDEDDGLSGGDDPDAPDVPPIAPRARRALALLALAGLDAKRLAPLEAGLEPDPSTSPAAYVALSTAIRRAWNDLAQPGVSQAPDGPDRLSLVLPPLEPSPPLDTPKQSPTVVLRANAWKDLWLLLADRFEVEANDLGGDRSLAEDAASLRDFTERTLRDLGLGLLDSDRTGPSPSSPFARPEAEAARLSLERPRAHVPVRLRGRDDDPTPWELSTVGADERWLRVRRDDPGGDPSDGPDRAAFLVELRPGAAGLDGPAPAGFLLRASRAGRHFHERVPVSFDLDVTQPRVLLSADPEKPTAPRGELRLRPLPGVQTFHLYVSNPADRGRKLEIELKTGDSAVVGGRGVLALGRGETRKVEFASPAPAPAPAAPPAPVPGDAPALASPPVVLPELTEAEPLTVVLRDAETGRTLVSKRLAVGVASPLEYVRVVGARFDPPGPATKGKNRLAVTLRAGPGFAGPPCVARLVLSPRRVPGLLGVRNANAQGSLAAAGESVTLEADDLVLTEMDKEGGTFTVDVDGVPRALIFRAVFAREGGTTTPALDFGTDLRARAGAVAASGGKFAVVPEPDNAPPGSRLEVKLGRAGLGGFEPDRVLPTLPAARHRRVGFALRDKALAFTAEVADWSVPIDSEGIEGHRLVQVRLVDGAGRTIRSVVVPVAFDRSPPEGVRILDPPARAKVGSTVTLRAVGSASTSGTREVVFFPGKPTADKKVPAGVATAAARPSDDDESTWSATLALPDKKGPADVSVAFVNAVGLAAFDTVTIELGDTAPVEFGRIVGTVTERDVLQPSCAVWLGTEKRDGFDYCETDRFGRYKFEKVPPGKYRVLAVQPATPSKALKLIDVPPGATITLDLNMTYGR